MREWGKVLRVACCVNRGHHAATLHASRITHHVPRGVFPTRRRLRHDGSFFMRPLWKGSISFGLVNIPVGLYSATQSAGDIKFHLLRDSDLSRIRYKRVAEADDKEVGWDHIVKGYEYEKGQYVPLSD